MVHFLQENIRRCAPKAFPVRNGAPDWDAGIDLTKDIGVLQTEEIYQITGLTMYNNKRFFSAGPQSVLSVILPEGDRKSVV